MWAEAAFGTHVSVNKEPAEYLTQRLPTQWTADGAVNAVPQPKVSVLASFVQRLADCKPCCS
jgi:hypothetical protein